MASASISYAIEVVGESSSKLARNKRVGAVFAVIPAAAPEDVDARQRLMAPWSGPFRDISKQESIRTAPWESYSHLEAILRLPDLPSFPISTNIPFRFRITTTTKPMAKAVGSAPVDKKGAPLFPAPPAQPEDVDFRLATAVCVIAPGPSDSATMVPAARIAWTTAGVGGISGFGQAPLPDLHDAMQVEVADPEWVATDGQKGAWRRETTFMGSIRFNCAPSFRHANLQCEVRWSDFVISPSSWLTCIRVSVQAAYPSAVSYGSQ